MTEHALEFFDFPAEKIKWTRIYQLPPKSRKSKAMKRELMMRPQYPPSCKESQMPHANTISEVTVVNSGVWKVGDLVDWWTDGCYWSGRVTQIFGNDKVQIEFPLPPDGEGSNYEVFCKDLRPSLDWSPEHGWSVPISKEGENYCRCARLIKPVNQGLLSLETIAVDRTTAGPVANASFSSLDESKISINKENPVEPLGIAIPKEETHRLETNIDLDRGDSAIGKASLSHKLGHVSDASAETSGNPAGEDQCYSHGPFKKTRTSGKVSLNSTCSDTIEAPISDLEELVNRVKWLKGILEYNVPLSNSGRPPWKFMEYRASSTTK